MKQFTLSTAITLITVTALLTSCHKAEEPIPAKSDSKTEQSAKIAYIEVDSLMTRYKFAKEYSGILKKKMETIQSTLNNKGLALQKEAADFQSKIQTGKISQDQASSIQSSLQKKQAQLQHLQESLSSQYQDLQDKYNDALRDSLQHFLASYNKAHGYDLVLSKSGDNILLGNPRLDITDDVIAGLNKRYKGMKK